MGERSAPRCSVPYQPGKRPLTMRSIWHIIVRFLQLVFYPAFLPLGMEIWSIVTFALFFRISYAVVIEFQSEKFSILLSILVAGLLAWSANRMFLRLVQAVRDLRAPRFVMDNKQFALYLRPFITAGIIATPEPVASTKGVADELEQKLFQTVLPEMRLISLGATKSSLGAPRIKTDDLEWMQKFHELAARCTVIFMLPPYTVQAAHFGN